MKNGVTLAVSRVIRLCSLLRYETQDALGASAAERPLLRREVRRRALRAVGLSA